MRLKHRAEAGRIDKADAAQDRRGKGDTIQRFSLAPPLALAAPAQDGDAVRCRHGADGQRPIWKSYLISVVLKQSVDERGFASTEGADENEQIWMIGVEEGVAQLIEARWSQPIDLRQRR